MPYKTIPPDPDTFVAEQKPGGARLYAYLADVPLYAHIRLICKGIIGKRESFRLGWIIEERRISNGKDKFVLPDSLLAWITARMSDAYPDHATATGLSPDEISSLKREQAEKRKKYQK